MISANSSVLKRQQEIKNGFMLPRSFDSAMLLLQRNAPPTLKTGFFIPIVTFMFAFVSLLSKTIHGKLGKP